MNAEAKNKSKRVVRFAVTAALATTALTACTGKVAPSANYAAVEAQAALAKGKPTKAIAMAEAAVLASPRDAALRTLLANAYFGAGRFQSAAATFGEAVELGDTAPRTIVSYSLALSAIGDQPGAREVLARFQEAIDPADYGLAITLAGNAEEGSHILGNALRNGSATTKVRQNLAYALAMQGNWEMARLMAAEDLAADQVDARLAQWAQVTRPEQYQARVTGVIGVAAVADSGQPAQLALANHPAATQLAAESAAQVAPAEAALESAPAFAHAAELPAVEATPAAFENAFADSGEAKLADAGLASANGFVAAPIVQPVHVAPVTQPASQSAVRQPVRTARTAPARAPAQRTPLAKGDHNIQLGAYFSMSEAQTAWKRFQARYPELSDAERVITKARVNGKIYYRVAAAGFAERSARAMCSTVKGQGGGCIAYAASRPLPGAINDKIRVAAR